VSTCSFSCSPANRPAPWRGPAPLSTRRRGGAPASGRAMRRPSSAGDPSCEPPRANAGPSVPVRPDAGRRPRRPRTTAARRTHCAQRGRPAAPSHARGPARCADSAAAEPRTPEARPSGHLDGTGRVDTGRVDTGRPLDRLDGRPHGGRRTRTGRGPAWPASGHPRNRRPPAGRPDLARVAASGALGHP
jgi:hypothetical protein